MAFSNWKTVRCDELYKDCPIQMYILVFLADPYKFVDFGVLLGMDWLARYQDRINCPKQRIILRGPKGKKVVHKVKVLKCGVRPIMAMEFQKLLGRGYNEFLCNVVDTETSVPSLNDIQGVQDLADLFPEEIPDKSPFKELEFCIVLVLEATLISKALYRMAPAKLKERKARLNELLEKGNRRPSMSP